MIVIVVVATWLSAGVPPLLRGIDTVPPVEVVARVPVADLIAVVADRQARPLWRARAARLLGARDIADATVDGVLRDVLGDADQSGALRAQLVLALAERAARRGAWSSAEALADDALADADADVRRAGVLLLWRLGGEANQRRLQALALRPDAVGGAARGRLRSPHGAGAWRRLDGDVAGDGVLDRLHGGPPPAR
jgi:hypothetical protein